MSACCGVSLYEARETIAERWRTVRAYCLQDKDELAQAAVRVSALSAERVLEIGTCEGGWLWVMAPFFKKCATLIAIEPMLKNIIRPKQLEELFARLVLDHPTHLVKHTSQSREAYLQVMDILRERTLDVLHIDGAHDEETVWADYKRYAPLVRRGGLILFHDVKSRAAAEKVYKVWDALCADPALKTSTISMCDNRVGIGVLEVTG